MRTLLRGLLIGVLLSALRASPGFDLTSLPMASAAASLGWRAAALALAGFALFVAIKRPGAALVFAAAAGFALHGLLLARWFMPESTLALVFTLAAGAVLAILVCLDERRFGEEPDPPHAHGAARAAERIGLFIAGCGAALSIESVARQVRAFGTGRTTDDTLFGLAFLLLAGAGALGLGWLARSKPVRGLALPFGLAGAAVLGFASLATLGHLDQTLLLERYVKTFGLDLGAAGTPAFDLLVGGALLAGPALLAGFALAGARDGAQLLAVFAGAAQGVLVSSPEVMDHVVALFGGAAEGVQAAGNALDAGAKASTFSAQLVPIGALVAITGALIAELSCAAPRKPARYAALAATIALVFVPVSNEVIAKPVRAPWQAQTVETTRMFLLAFDTPEGLLTIESLGGSPPIATLDGRALTTGLTGALGEMERIQLAARCVPPAKAGAPRRVLLVGQLDPLRAFALQQQGFTHVDRTAVWHAAMPRAEEKLFTDVKARAVGDVLSPAEARARIARGDYALVLVPAVGGDAPCVPALDVPESTVAVVWLRAESGVAARELGDDVIVQAQGLDDVCIGATKHAVKPAEASAASPQWAAPGARLAREWPLAQALRRDSPREPVRSEHERARTFQRFARAASGPCADVFTALAGIADAQAASSPFESPEQQVELPRAELERLRDATIALPLDGFLRGTWDGIAATLAGKRDVESVRACLEPLARVHTNWPEIEKTLARADLEALEPADAVSRLAAIEALSRDDFDYWSLRGEACRRARDAAGSVSAWRRALELRPEHPAILRRLGPALVRQGDPQGRAIVEKLLATQPNDPELTPFLAPGPWPDDDAGR